MASSKDATAQIKKSLHKPTHEEILAAMDQDTLAHVSPQDPNFEIEYRRTMFWLMPQELKEQKKINAQKRVLDEEQTKLFDLQTYGLSSANIIVSKYDDKFNNHQELYEKLIISFYRSKRMHEKSQTDPFREHQSLQQIRDGFVAKFNSTGEDEATIASLNQMLDDIYALCVTKLEAKIKVEEEKLSKLMQE
jgi:hypothetical protein